MSTEWRFLTQVFGVLIVAFASSFARATDPEAQSLLSAIQTNAAAIESFDLIVESSTFSKAPEKVATIEIVERVVIDKKSGIAAYFKRGKRSAVLSNSESTESDSADKAKFLYEAWLFRDGEASQRPFPSPLMKVFETSLDGFLQKAKCVNPRSIGSTLFSECREWGGAAALTETRFRSLARVKDANAIHPTVQAEVIGKNYSVIFEWDFSDGLMPRMLSTFAKGNGRTVRNCNEIMRWGTIEGISVPVSVENDSIVGVYGTDGSEQVAEVQDDHKLYWLALNKNVQTDSLTESNIVSMKYVMEMTNLESYRSKCLTKSNAK